MDLDRQKRENERYNHFTDLIMSGQYINEEERKKYIESITPKQQRSAKKLETDFDLLRSLADAQNKQNE